jgi:hypothetical protein
MKRAFQHAITPLAFYYAVALAFPLVNGAGGRAFREHAIMVLAVPPALVALCGMVRALAVLSFRGAMGMTQGAHKGWCASQMGVSGQCPEWAACQKLRWGKRHNRAMPAAP